MPSQYPYANAAAVAAFKLLAPDYRTAKKAAIKYFAKSNMTNTTKTKNGYVKRGTKRRTYSRKKTHYGKGHYKKNGKKTTLTKKVAKLEKNANATTSRLVFRQTRSGTAGGPQRQPHYLTIEGISINTMTEALKQLRFYDPDSGLVVVRDAGNNPDTQQQSIACP